MSNKVATNCTPADAKIYVTSSDANAFSIDPYVNGGSSGSQYNTNATDDVHNCGDQMPSVSLTVSDNTTGQPTSTCTSNGCTITVAVTQGTHPLSSSKFPGTVTISVNGKAVKTFAIPQSASGTWSPTTAYNYTPTQDGNVTITAQVTDSVPYQGSDTQTITNSITNPNPTQPTTTQGRPRNLSKRLKL